MNEQLNDDIIVTIESVEKKENGIQYSLDLLEDLIEIHTDDELLLNTTLKVIQNHLLAEQFIIENFVKNVKPYLKNIEFKPVTLSEGIDNLNKGFSNE